jgi:hypothetical protein
MRYNMRLLLLFCGVLLILIGRISTMTMPCFIHDGYTAVAVVVVIVGLLLLASWGQALVLPMTTLGCGDKPHMLTYLHHDEIEAVIAYNHKNHGTHVVFNRKLHGVQCYAPDDELMGDNPEFYRQLIEDQAPKKKFHDNRRSSPKNMSTSKQRMRQPDAKLKPRQHELKPRQQHRYVGAIRRCKQPDAMQNISGASKTEARSRGSSS